MGNNTSMKSSSLPGKLLNVGEEFKEKAKILIFSYNENDFEEKVFEFNNIKELNIEKSQYHWISVEGINDIDIIQSIGDKLGLHPLVIKDILNPNQRPKIESYDEYMYIVAKVLLYDEENSELSMEHECYIIGENFLISFSEKNTEIYNPVKDRLRNNLGHIRKAGSDYLFYSLLDLVVDKYFDVLEKISEEIEIAEDELIVSPSKEALNQIHKFKRQMLYMHKAVWPLREVLAVFERNEVSLIKENTGIYLRDLYNHVIQIMDTVETLRDILSSMMDIYLSSISNKMNEVMKILTIISTVFIPLTFLVGVYGMNFKYMPELDSPIMYPVLWVIMISIAALMLAFFKKKKWW